ncbi:hypothetical protein [Moraxella nasibovis]|nr:hypothetical protein [Moraxella nasibovis]
MISTISSQLLGQINTPMHQSAEHQLAEMMGICYNHTTQNT